MLRKVRSVLLAIVAALMLLSATAGIANASPGNGAAADDAFTANADPGDPGFPPDE